jgi:general stress protein 26
MNRTPDTALATDRPFVAAATAPSPPPNPKPDDAEDSQRDLAGAEAVEKMRDLLEDAGTVFFCTRERVGASEAARPMSVRETDDAGRVWFLSSRDSLHNAEIVLDPEVTLYAQSGRGGGFAMLKGRATIHTDRTSLERLWTPMARNWFAGGLDDPRLSAIAVHVQDGYYWETKHGAVVAGLKMLFGAALGQPMDDGVEGAIRP